MECSLAIKGISGAKILRELQGSFLKLTGMEFSFIDLKGKPAIVPQRASHFCKALILVKKKDTAFCALLNKSCEQIAVEKKPCVFEYNRSLFAAVPIVAQEKVIGAVLMCPLQASELSTVPVTKEQARNAAELLFILINYIFKNEFDFLVVSDSDMQYSRNQEAVISAINYIKKNYYNKDISLQKVSSEVSLSHYYFSHIFKNEFKITFIEYLTKVRMEASAKLLKNRKLNVNQVAYAVGYQDPNYFSKVFKRYMKTSPIEYRESLFKKGVEKQIITA